MTPLLAVLNWLVNPVVRRLLRSPLHGPLSRSVALLSYTGRRSGREYTLPVMYAEVTGTGGRVLVVVPGAAQRKRWWRNLIESTPVSVRVRGEQLTGTALALTDGGPDVVSLLRAYVARFPRAARSLGIPRDAGRDDAAWSDAADRQVVVTITAVAAEADAGATRVTTAESAKPLP